MVLITVLLLALSARAEEEIGKFRNTFYYVALEGEYPNDPRDAAFLSMDDQVLARVSAAFKRAADIEGTAKLVDGRVLNFAGRKDGQVRWRFTDAPYGLGKGDCQLIPFGTVAVDPARIPLGSLVRIVETEGMALPDGSRHSGIWRAEDVGSAIKKDRIDLFIGERRHKTVLESHGISHLEPLTMTVVSPPPPDHENCVYRDLQSPSS